MSALTLARAPRVAPGKPLSARRALSGHAAPLCVAAPPARAGRALRLAVRAAKEAPNKYKAGSGSFVPWADPMVQRQFQLSDKVTDWTILGRMLQRTPPKEDKGIIGLAKAESAMRGGEAMNADKLTIGDYVAARSLTADVWVELAVTRAGVYAPNMRRALGVILSGTSVDKVMGGLVRDAYTMMGRCLTSCKEDFAALLAAAVAEVVEVKGLMSDGDVQNGAKISKNGYDADTTEAIFKWLADAPVAAADAITFPLTDGTVIPLLMPTLRERAAPADADEEAEDAAIEAALQEATLRAVSTKGSRTVAAFGDQRIPDLTALIRKQARVGFPELVRWQSAPGAPADADEKMTAIGSVAMLMDVAMRLAEKAGGQKLHVWVPGAFMASIITFGTGRLGPALTVGVPSAPVPEGAGVLYCMFDPPAVQTPAEAAAVAEQLKKTRAAGSTVAVLAIGRMRRAALADGGAAARDALLKAVTARLGA